jgi:hypothetical protein
MHSASGLAFPKLLWVFAVIARADPGTMMLIVFKQAMFLPITVLLTRGGCLLQLYLPQDVLLVF